MMELNWLPLHSAAEEGKAAQLEVILNEYPDSVDKGCGLWGRTALHVSCENGHLDVVNVLLKNGASPNLCGNDGWGPLHYAARKGRLNIVERLLKAGVTVIYENGAESPLTLAVRSSHTEVVKVLLEHGSKVDCLGRADIPGEPDSQRLPLFYAIRSGSTEMIRILHEAGADLIVDGSGRPALGLAAERNLEAVKCLVALGANVNQAENRANMTPLHIAVIAGQEEITTFLLKAGARVDLKARTGLTPIHFAVSGNNPKEAIVDLLLHHGANYKAVTFEGVHAVDLACQKRKKCSLEIVRCLIKHGAIVSADENACPRYICHRNHTISKLSFVLLKQVPALDKHSTEKLVRFFHLLEASGYPIHGEQWIDAEELMFYKVDPRYIGMLRRHLHNPLPLQQLAVISVRKSMQRATGGRSILSNIDQLHTYPVMKDLIGLKDFLNFHVKM